MAYTFCFSYKNYLSTKWLLSLVIFTCALGFFSVPESVQAACFNYAPNYNNPGPTYRLDGSGYGDGTSLVYQNPPTIFQKIYFIPLAPYDPCVPTFYFGERASQAFVTDSGIVQADGFYLQDYTPDLNYLLNFWASPFLDITEGSAEERIAKLEKIISHIDARNTITTRVGSGSSGKIVDVTAPATNCVHISGNGPHKVVFMRGKSLDLPLDLSNFLNDAFSIIEPTSAFHPKRLWGDRSPPSTHLF